jgi:Ser/Thr protein kinase RdoA (MazF antagonist)
MKGTEPPPDDCGLFESLGTITAHLHEHSQRWTPAQKGLSRHTWDLDAMFLGEKPLWGRWQDGLGVAGPRARILERLEHTLHQRLTLFGKTPDRFGLVHTDLRHANLLVDDKKIHAIDFDDSGFSWWLYDLAGALSFIEDQPQVPRLIKTWLRGYRAIRPLSETDESEIPTFIMARRLLLVAWIGSHQEAPFPRQLGEPFTEGTCRLAEKYLADYQTA